MRFAARSIALLGGDSGSLSPSHDPHPWAGVSAVGELYCANAPVGSP